MRRLFILLPSFTASSPVRGAVALANEAVEQRPVTLVGLKPGESLRMKIDPRIQKCSLAQHRTFWTRLRAYRALLKEAGGRENVFSLSYCFSPDMTNAFCGSRAVTCASIRGNLLSNYWLQHGLIGLAAAYLQFFGLRRFDFVVAMSEAMADQLAPFAGKRPRVIGNFVDEEALEPMRRKESRTGPLRFIFLGALSRLKQPLTLLPAIASLKAQGHDVHLDIVGKGDLRADCEREIARLSLEKNVTLHGHQQNPYPLLAQADCFVLPSFSEGISRAAMEALYLGVPCILRKADGNGELVSDPAQGALFNGVEDLPALMSDVAQRSRAQLSERPILLPPAFRKAKAVQDYLALMEKR